MGTAAASAGAAGLSEGLRAGRISGWTEAGVYRGERTTRLRERADDRDLEPDYLLRPTMHGQGGTLLIIAHTGHHLSVGSFAIQRKKLQRHIALKETLRLNQK